MAIRFLPIFCPYGTIYRKTFFFVPRQGLNIGRKRLILKSGVPSGTPDFEVIGESVDRPYL
jgi:hypothetical protein